MMLYEYCDLKWEDGKYCENKRTTAIEVCIHSNIFTGIHEIGNKYNVYHICDKHFELIKNDPNVRMLSKV